MIRLWMLWTQAPHRMDTKMYLTYLSIFLFMMLRVSRTNSHADEKGHMNTSTESATTVVTVSRVEGRVTREVGTSPEISPEQTTNQHGSVSLSNPTSQTKSSAVPSVETTDQPKLTSTSASPVKTVQSAPGKKWTAILIWNSEWDKDFTYDYESVRNAGLVIAAVLFILGILVITCGKLSRLPKCPKGSTKSYRVVQG
ncbi:FXYD domain containing ion transport regulator 5 [Archocentrus centrarchus]|uniref:FXYD domain containing ion transport regulator 5 n=1 Tax=Archocentrus centrarchus TaxID=63155 RepID=UPI0011EA1D54|nr:FXYD domain-containing ion transport regulator 5-like [Archocentrus centrarchus]